MKRWKDKNGYTRQAIQHHPKSRYGSVHEHILVMEKYLGRALPAGTVVHHRNRIRSDNRIENLLLLRDETEHKALHQAMKTGNLLLVDAYEAWSKDLMEKLKNGVPFDQCFSPREVANTHKFPTEFLSKKQKLALSKILLKELKEERLRLAKENSVPAYIIFHDTTLEQMSILIPESPETLLLVKGVGKQKLDKYGERFLKIIKTFKSRRFTAIIKKSA